MSEKQQDTKCEFSEGRNVNFPHNFLCSKDLNVLLSNKFHTINFYMIYILVNESMPKNYFPFCCYLFSIMLFQSGAKLLQSTIVISELNQYVSNSYFSHCHSHCDFCGCSGANPTWRSSSTNCDSLVSGSMLWVWVFVLTKE